MASSAKGVFFVLALGSALVIHGCASQESVVAKAAAGDKFKCPPGDLEVSLERETPKVREYVVGCNFMYERVHCTEAGCAHAPTPPPCIGELPCFEEDPVTLEWQPTATRN